MQVTVNIILDKCY